MNLLIRRGYRGPLQAIVFDWAGTTVDFGSCAPAGVFVEVFRRQKVEITQEEARGPMGMHKRDHLAEILKLSDVADRWSRTHGRPSSESDIDRMFDLFVSLQIECLRDYAELTPGTLEAVADCRKRGMKIGTSTGYNREMLEILLEEAGRRGFNPDSSVCAEDVPAGRPAPWMCFQNALNLNRYPMEAFVKIGDTVSDIQEGLNAGMWTVGVTKAGNEVGLSFEESESMAETELRSRIEGASRRLSGAGAHFLVETLEGAPSILDQIQEKLNAGERP